MSQQFHLVYTQQNCRQGRKGRDNLYATFMAILSTVVKAWRQPKCSSVDTWINKMWLISTVVYYSALKKRRKIWHILQQCWTLKTVCEVTQASHKMASIVWFLFYKVPRVVRFIDNRTLVTSGGWCGERRMGSECLMGTESQLGKMKTSWSGVVVMVARCCEYT